MQQELTAGDTLNFATSTPGYSAADGWVLSFRLVPRSASAAVITINTTAEGADHRAQVAPNVTAAYAAGQYTWHSWVVRSAETYTISSGQITIKPDPRAVTAGYDGRSLAPLSDRRSRARISKRERHHQTHQLLAARS
jgi:hypothetical protein